MNKEIIIREDEVEVYKGPEEGVWDFLMETFTKLHEMGYADDITFWEENGQEHILMGLKLFIADSPVPSIHGKSVEYTLYNDWNNIIVFTGSKEAIQKYIGNAARNLNYKIYRYWNDDRPGHDATYFDCGPVTFRCEPHISEFSKDR